jgi:hypothetical protein
VRFVCLYVVCFVMRYIVVCYFDEELRSRNVLRIETLKLECLSAALPYGTALLFTFPGFLKFPTVVLVNLFICI